ncbi:MAG: hypothetical protein KVP17_001393 [Porospora cf. gigantea B]|nr:MAG: hypothetical protein KVP17_001393 [Porospora cf. gigantea B]
MDLSRVERELRAALSINNWDPDSFVVRQMRRPPDKLAGLFFFSLEESSEKAVREGIRSREYLRRIGFRFELARNQQGSPQVAMRFPRMDCRRSEDVDDIPSNVKATIAPSKEVDTLTSTSAPSKEADTVTSTSAEILQDDVSSGANSSSEFFTGFWTIFQFDKE